MPSFSPSSTSSHAQTTHSSPWDGDGTEMMKITNSHTHVDQQLLDFDTDMNTFRLMESPRDVLHATHIQGCSDQAISDRESQLPDRDTLSSIGSTRFKQRHHCRCHIEDESTTKRCRSWFPLIRNVLLILTPPSIILVLTHFNRTYLFMLVLDIVVAFGGLELSWWHYRIRERLLAPFKNQQLPQQDPVSAREQQCAAAIIAIKIGRGSKYSIAFSVAGGLACVAALVCIMCHSHILVDSPSSLGWVILAISSSLSVFSTLLCVFFAPTLADAFVVLVYGTCFTVSSLNSFLAHHEHLISDPELLDSLYVLLVGACTIIVWRIVSSKEVLESMLMVMMDILGLVYLVAPSMSMSDFLGNPMVMVHDRLVMFFFLIVAAAEGGSRLHSALQRSYPQLSFSHCHRPVHTSLSVSFDVENFVVAFVAASIAACVAEIVLKGPIKSVTGGIVLVTVVGFSQYCRLALVTMMNLAKVANIERVEEQRHWIAGVMETVNPYLLATIVFHPYAKSLINNTGQT